MAPNPCPWLRIEASCSDQLAALGIISETQYSQGDTADTFQQQASRLQDAVRAIIVGWGFKYDNYWKMGGFIPEPHFACDSASLWFD